MYILCKLENRAETVDTIMFCASPDRETLEEILLSLYDELEEKEYAAIQHDWTEDINHEAVRFWCRQRLYNYHIVWVPVIT